MSNRFTSNKIRFCHSYKKRPCYPFAVQSALPANMLGILMKKKNPKNFHGGESYVVASLSGRNSKSDYSRCIFKFPFHCLVFLQPHLFTLTLTVLRIESVLPYLEPFVHGSPLACSKIVLPLMLNHSPLSTIPPALPLCMRSS